MVSFSLRQVTSIVDGPAYQVTNQVTAATGADANAFVFDASSQKFSHYATAADYEQWPVSFELAQVMNLGFYRLASVTRTWKSVAEMNDDLSDTLRRVQALADELNDQQGSLIIDRTTLIQGA